MILREAGRRSEDDALRRCSTNGRERGRMTERAFGFLRINERESKPRSRGLTEIRGPTTRQSGGATSKTSSSSL
jgi:hypothetical protein